MDAAKALKTLLKEAEIYQTQGLLSEARKKYESAIALINDTPDFQNRDELLEGVQKKVGSLEKVVYRVEKRTVAPEISGTDKELIKKLFSFPAEQGDPISAAIEGAMALAKFGIFERAIQEFELLLDEPERRLEVAKHILRCHMAIRNAHDPTVQFQKWAAPDTQFTSEELDSLQVFLSKTYGMQTSAPPLLPEGAPLGASSVSGGGSPGPKGSEMEPPPKAYDPYEDSYEDVLDEVPKAGASNTNAPASEKAMPYDALVDSFMPRPKLRERGKLPGEESNDEYIDYVSSIGIPVSLGPRKGQVVDIPVNLQTNDAINIIIASVHRDVVVMMKKGARIENLKLKSPISTSSATGMVKAVALIDQGPRQGDYSVDMKIVSPG